MSLVYPDLTALSETQVQDTLDFLAQQLAEYSPSLDGKRGLLRDIVLHLESVFATATGNVVQTQITESGSLLAVSEDPSLADEDAVDRLLSNFRITRRPSAKSSGSVTIVLDSLYPVVIPGSAQFLSGSIAFEASSAYAARTDSSFILGTTDRLLESIGGGEYAFNIEVDAVEAGSSGQIRRGASLSPSFSIPHFLRAYAEQDFTGGQDAQTNEELLHVLDEGLSDKSPSNRTGVAALIHNTAEFASVTDISVIGFGDSEQIRYHSIFPVAFGGRVDVYARTQGLFQSVKVTKTAVLVEKPAGDINGVWQLSLARGDAPGFYEVERVCISGDTGAGYPADSTAKDLDLTDDGEFIPDLETSDEAAFSRFQSAVVRFTDTDTSTAGLTVNSSTADYDIYVRAMPLIEDLQIFLGDRDRRPMGSDILVKAPVPCFVSLSFSISKLAGQDDPDLSAIKTSMADYVNGLGFNSVLSASALAHEVYSHLSAGQTCSTIDMHGRVLYPDGRQTFLHSSVELTAPTASTSMVSDKTVCFFLDPLDIDISVVE